MKVFIEKFKPKIEQNNTLMALFLLRQEKRKAIIEYI